MFFPVFAFLQSALGRYIILGLTVLFLLGGAYVKGRLDCTALAKSDTLRAEVSMLKAQIKAANELLDAARLRENETQEYAADLSKRVADYESSINRVPVSRSCGLTRTDVERLRNIATGATPH